MFSEGHYHEDRVPTTEEASEIVKLVNFNIPIGKIVSHIAETTRKVLKTSDVHNITNKHKDVYSSVKDETWAVLERMKDSDNPSHVSLVTDESSGNVNVLFFQTASMRLILGQYPSVVYMDGTYCLNNLGYPVYVFMVTDGNMKGHAVGYAVVKDETKVTLSQLLTQFVNKNPVSINTFVVDKDAAEIAAVKNVLPHISILLFRFHVSVNFHDAVGKYCRKKEKELTRQTLDSMLYTDKTAHFDNLVEELKSYENLYLYFKKNWLPIAHCWAQCHTKNITTWGDFTNNVVER